MRLDQPPELVLRVGRGGHRSTLETVARRGTRRFARLPGMTTLGQLGIWRRRFDGTDGLRGDRGGRLLGGMGRREPLGRAGPPLPRGDDDDDGRDRDPQRLAARPGRRGGRARRGDGRLPRPLPARPRDRAPGGDGRVREPARGRCASSSTASTRRRGRCRTPSACSRRSGRGCSRSPPSARGGAHTYFVTPQHTAAARGPGPRRAARPRGRRRGRTDVETARKIAREYARTYLGLSNYTANLRRYGYTDADISGGGSDRLIDAVIPHGTAGEVAEALRSHLDAGADHVAVQALRGRARRPTTSRRSRRRSRRRVGAFDGFVLDGGCRVALALPRATAVSSQSATRPSDRGRPPAPRRPRGWGRDAWRAAPAPLRVHSTTSPRYPGIPRRATSARVQPRAPDPVPLPRRFPDASPNRAA